MAQLVKKLLNNKNDPIDIASKFLIEELESIILYTTDKYFNTTPVITDELYDILIDFLKLKSPTSTILKNIGYKIKSKNKVKLDYWLGSMDKIKPPTNQLYNWTKKYTPPYNLSDKLDGISALLTYNFNGSINLFTRGTADEGMDISHLVKYLNLPNYNSVSTYCLNNNIKGESNLIAFRGELIIKKVTFQKKWSKQLKNARNSVSGLVNSKKINAELAQDTELILYEIVDPFYKIEKQFELIKQLGFKIVINKMSNQTLTFEYLSEFLKERREQSDYNIDGIIITHANNKIRNIDGNPKYAIAYKDILEDQKAITTIIKIEWNISKSGLIKPTLLLEPVNIGGVEIKRATANNAKFVVDNILGPGAEIELIRSGDVIPKVQKVLKIAIDGIPSMPEYKWTWNETNVDITINNIHSNSDVLIKNIYHFFSTLNTHGLGEKKVEKLVNHGLNSIIQILEADNETFINIEGFAERSALNLVVSIKKALTNISLSKLMAASNKLGIGIGEEKMKHVLSVYPNLIIDYKKWSKTEFINNLIQINGWEKKTATLLVNNFDDFINFYNLIKKYITLEITKETINNSLSTHKNNNILIGKIIVFTGFRDKILQEKMELNGIIIGTTITKKTNYLIVKDQTMIDNPTEKVKKAQELKIIIITKENIIKLLI
jgi:DNA ligase (NAD+)